jgi:hypothetical protein
MSELLSLPLAARRLRVPAGWLRSEALAGRVPVLRAGRRLLFNVDAVRAALLERAKHTLEMSQDKSHACAKGSRNEC